MRRLRVILPAIGVVLAVFLLGAALLPSLLPGIGLGSLNLTRDGLAMNNPKLSGHLDADRRYSVTADRAIQSLLDPSQLTLENIRADLEMGDDGWVRITGAEAFYDTDTEVLRLIGGISVTSSDGHEAEMQSATVFLDEGRFVSLAPLTINSPRGEITAGRLDVAKDGDVVRLKGGVNLTINPADTKKEKS